MWLTFDAFDPFVAGFDAVGGQFVQFRVGGKITQHKSTLVQQFDRNTFQINGGPWFLALLPFDVRFVQAQMAVRGVREKETRYTRRES